MSFIEWYATITTAPVPSSTTTSATWQALGQLGPATVVFDSTKILLIAIPETGARDVACACAAVAVLGRVLAQAVPASPATDPQLAFNWNPFSETWRNLKLAHQNVVVFRSLLGISWMWFFGAVFLSQFA